MPKLVVYEMEFRVGFKKGRDAATILLGTPSIPAGLMLLFYAVECGLKHLLCVRNRGSYLERDHALLMTHDLSSLVKELRFPVDPLPQAFKLARDKASQLPTSESHLAWRYGPAVVDADQAKLKLGLELLVERISEDIP